MAQLNGTQLSWTWGGGADEGWGAYSSSGSFTTPDAGWSKLRLTTHAAPTGQSHDLTIIFSLPSGMSLGRYALKVGQEAEISLPPNRTINFEATMPEKFQDTDTHFYYYTVITFSGASVTKCKVPTTMYTGEFSSDVRPIFAPGSKVIFKWSGANSGGQWNPIKGYKIYWAYRPGQGTGYDGTVPTSEFQEIPFNLTTPSSDSNSISESSRTWTVPSNAGRGGTYYFRMKTLAGYDSAYDSDFSPEFLLRVNKLPDAPLIKRIKYQNTIIQADSTTNFTNVPTLPSTGGIEPFYFNLLYTTEVDGNTRNMFDSDGQAISYYYRRTTSDSYKKITRTNQYSDGISVYPTSSGATSSTYLFYTFDGLEYSAPSKVTFKFNTPPAGTESSFVLQPMQIYSSEKNTSGLRYAKNFYSSGGNNPNNLKHRWFLQINGANMSSHFYEGWNLSDSVQIADYVKFGQRFKIGRQTVDSFGDTSAITWDNETFIIPEAPTLKGYNTHEEHNIDEKWPYIYKNGLLTWTQDTGLQPENIEIYSSGDYEARTTDWQFNEDGTGSLKLTLRDGAETPALQTDVPIVINFHHGARTNENTRSLVTYNFARPGKSLLPARVNVTQGNSSANRLHFYTETDFEIAYSGIKEIEDGENLPITYEIALDNNGQELILPNYQANYENQIMRFSQFGLVQLGESGYYDAVFSDLLNSNVDIKLRVSRVSPEGERFSTLIDLYGTFKENITLLTDTTWLLKCLGSDDEYHNIPHEFELFSGETLHFSAKLKSFNAGQLIIQPQICRIQKRQNSELIDFNGATWNNYGEPFIIELTNTIPEEFLEGTKPCRFFGNIEKDYVIKEIIEDSWCAFRLCYTHVDTNQENVSFTSSLDEQLWYGANRCQAATMSLIKTIYTSNQDDKIHVESPGEVTPGDWKTELMINDLGTRSFTEESYKTLSFEYSDQADFGFSTRIVPIFLTKYIDPEETTEEGVIERDINAEAAPLLNSQLPIDKYNIYYGKSNTTRPPEFFFPPDTIKLTYVYFRAKLEIPIVYHKIDGVLPAGPQKITSYSPIIVVLNKIPTLCYRQNRLGINTNNFSSDLSQNAVLNILGTTQFYNLVFSTLDDTSTERAINLVTGRQQNFIFDGGEWT